MRDITTFVLSAVTAGEVWVLERSVFQQIMMRTGMQKLQEQVRFLRTVPLFKHMSEDQLLRLSDAFEVVGLRISNQAVQFPTLWF